MNSCVCFRCVESRSLGRNTLWCTPGSTVGWVHTTVQTAELGSCVNLNWWTTNVNTAVTRSPVRTVAKSFCRNEHCWCTYAAAEPPRSSRSPRRGTPKARLRGSVTITQPLSSMMEARLGSPMTATHQDFLRAVLISSDFQRGRWDSLTVHHRRLQCRRCLHQSQRTRFASKSVLYDYLPF